MENQATMENSVDQSADQGSGKSWINAICGLSIVLAIIDFFHYLSNFIDPGDAPRYSKLQRYMSVSDLIPQWVVDLGFFAASICIFMILRKHFYAKRTIFTQYLFVTIIIYLLSSVSQMLYGDSYLSVSVWLSWTLIFVVYELIIGIKIIKNFSHTTLLGMSTIVYSLVTLITSICLANENISDGDRIILYAIDSMATILWMIVVIHYFKTAPSRATPSNLTTRIQSAETPKNKQITTAVIWSSILTAVLIIASAFIQRQEPLYLIGEMELNSNHTYYVAIASNDTDDVSASSKGWCGDLQIVAKKADSKYDDLSPILKGSQIEADIYQVLPSSISGDLIYFNAIGYNDFEVMCGKVDMSSQKYDIFPGSIVGMIRFGSFENCYLVERGDKMYIFAQSAVGQSKDPVAVFDTKEYFDGADFSDPQTVQSVIEWIQNKW